MKRLEAIDWVRGVGVVCMVIYHCADAFGALHSGWFYWLSHFIGGGAAPIFLTLAGVSVGLACSRGVPAKKLAWRGFEVWAAALLFRLQEWALGGQGARSESLLRVDVLNCIGLSIMLLAAVLAIAPKWQAPALLGLAMVALTPAVQGASWLAALPPALRYHFGGPRGLALFPLFGWAGVAMLGGAFWLAAKDDTGLMRLSRWALIAYVAVVALRAFAPAALAFHQDDKNPVFTIERVLGTMSLFVICQQLVPRFPAVVASWLRKLGQNSLVIYWVHVELVYGLLLYRFHGKLGPAGTTLVALLVLVAMSILAFVLPRLVRYVSGVTQHFAYQGTT